MLNPKITVSIVLYKTPRTQLDGVLKSVLSSAVEKIFLIDNSPDDHYREIENLSQKIRYIHNANLGYGASHNLAMSLATEENAEFHAVLNPDITFGENTFETLANFMQKNKDAVFAMPKIFSPDGNVQKLCKLLPTPFDLIFRRFLPKTKFFKKIDDRYTLSDFNFDHVAKIPVLSGCFMFLRLPLLVKNKIFFDDSFFMYLEDVDFARRLHSIGRTYFCPDAVAIHNHEQASYHDKKALHAHIKSAIHYFNKWGWFFDKERKVINKKAIEEISLINTMQNTRGGGIL